MLAQGFAASAYLSKAAVPVEIRDNQTIAAKVPVLLFEYLLLTKRLRSNPRNVVNPDRFPD